MKVIQKQALPSPGGYGQLMVPPGGRIVGVTMEMSGAYAHVEGQSWGGTVYWEVQVVRAGESFPDGMQYLGMFHDINTPLEAPQHLYVVGRING